jgi:hypothetical protein
MPSHLTIGANNDRRLTLGSQVPILEQSFGWAPEDSEETDKPQRS